MMLKVVYQVSDKVIAKELIETGIKGERVREVYFNLPELDTGVRQKLVEIKAIDLGKGTGTVSQKVDITNHIAWSDSRSRKHEKPVEFDDVPTIDQVIQFFESQTKYSAEIEAKKAEEEEKERKAKLVEAEEKEKIDEMEVNQDLEGLNSYTIPKDFPSDSRGLYAYSGKAYNIVKKELSEAGRKRWVMEHGSDHLKKGISEDYDCQRLYVVERAAKEAPLFVVDFNGSGRHESRTCPSMEALELADKAKELNLGTPQIVWVTKEPSFEIPQNENDDDNNYEYYDHPKFTPAEAILLENFLGSYDLYRFV